MYCLVLFSLNSFEFSFFGGFPLLKNIMDRGYQKRVWLGSGVNLAHPHFIKFMTHKMLNISQNSQLTLILLVLMDVLNFCQIVLELYPPEKCYCLLKAWMWPFLLFLLSDLCIWTRPILKFFFSSVQLAEGFHLLHTLCCVLVDVKMDIFACSTIFRVSSVFLDYLCFCIWTVWYFYIWIFVTSCSSSTKHCLIVKGFF